MPHLSLSLLGRFQANLDGQPLTELKSDKAQALLAFLVVEVDQVHRRDRLAGLLWPDWPDTNARANLRHALNTLRTVLGDRGAARPFLLTDRQSLRFNPDSDYELDVTRFSRQLEGLTALESGRADEQAVKRLRQAVELYTGPFLRGFYLEDCADFEEWSLLTRERLQLQLLAGLRRLALHFEQVGEYETALPYARRRVEIDALQEEAQRHLMRLLAFAGQRSAAMLQFESCRQLLAEELGVEPGAETLALHQQIQTGQLTLPVEPGPVAPSLSPPAPPRHNLPAQTTRFIGRQAELAAVRDKLLEPHVRLLTLTGPGGTGKTRLALQVANEVLEHFVDGVFVVFLAPVRESKLVDATIAEVLDVPDIGSQPILELLRVHLQDKQLLLILDNFEHVLAAAPLVAELLAAAPELKILVTSRSLLQVYGEYHYPVLPLPLPASQAALSVDSLLENEACQLFIDRAQAIRPNFTLSNDNALAVAQICVKLDGLPLALELAAARIKLLPPSKLLAQLNHRLQFLTKGAKDLPARHQTLRNTLDWSYELLEPGEQLLFQRLAVFVGGYSLEAAKAVGNLSGEIDVLDGLESLVDKSLLTQTEVADEPRFGMLQTLREYGLERLHDNGEAEIVYRTYLNYYVDWVATTTQSLGDSDKEAWLTAIEMEHDNLRVALQWARDHKEIESGLRLVGMLWPFWIMRAYVIEGRRRLEEALVGSEAAALTLRAEAYTGAGTVAYRQGDYDRATHHHQAALALYRQVGDEEGMAFALNNIGVQAYQQGDYDRAAEFHDESLALARKGGNKRMIFHALHSLGEAARLQGSYERAGALYEEALVVIREAGDQLLVIYPLNMLGVVKCHLGDYEQAAAHLKEGLLRSQNLGFKDSIAYNLQAHAGLAATQAQPERAARLLGAVEILREEIGVPTQLSDQGDYDRAVALAFDGLGETAFASAWTAGRAMTLEQAVAFALEESD